MSERRLVYGNYTQDELNVQYEQRTLVPDVAPYMAYWASASAAARAALDCRLDVAYGPGAAERLDIFPVPGATGVPVHVHIHGGAWRLLSRADASFPAPNFVAAGAAFVALDIASVNDASLDEVVRQARAGVAWVHQNAATFGADPDRLTLSGHSSGAHLAATVLADGWRAAHGLPEAAIKGALLLSGPYDLAPVRLSARNDFLHLDEAAARRLSGLYHVPKNGPPLVVGWGEGEHTEYRRQGAAMAAAWAAAGNPVETMELPGLNHFDVSQTFGDPDSIVVRTALAQMGLG